MIVRRAYVSLSLTDPCVRGLKSYDGRVFFEGEWREGVWVHETLPGEFRRWVDVPQAWLGFIPWFPDERRS